MSGSAPQPLQAGEQITCFTGSKVGAILVGSSHNPWKQALNRSKVSDAACARPTVTYENIWDLKQLEGKQEVLSY
jgi:hypothetical protein